MALISCPECKQQVSTAAKICPHCGYPISEQLSSSAKQPIPAPSTKCKYTFVECNPNDFKISKKGVFKYTGKADAIIIPDEVTHIENASIKSAKAVKLGKNVESFFSRKLDWIEVSEENPYFTSVDGILFSKDRTKLIRYPSSRKESEYIVPENVVSIGAEAFRDTKLSKIILHDKVTLFEDDCFAGMKKLKTIDLPSTITKIPNRMFSSSCIEKIDIPDSVEEIGRSPFYECAIKDFKFPKAIKTLEECAFLCCKDLKKIVIPETIDIIPSSCFSSCENLEEIVFPDSIKKIEKGAFYNCKSLRSISIPDGVGVIPSSCFYSCESLSKVKLPNSLKIIDENAFIFCKSLHDITLPDYLEVIGKDAFGWTGIKSIKIPASVKDATNVAEYIPNIETQHWTAEMISQKKEADNKRAEEKRWKDELAARMAETEKLLEDLDKSLNKYKYDAERLMKKRQEARSRLNSLLKSGNLYEYNRLMLDVNEIPKDSVHVYSCCGNCIKLYARNKVDATFACEVNGRVYAINAGGTEMINVVHDRETDTSELDKGIITGIAGGAFLGYLATTVAKSYITINESFTFADSDTLTPLVDVVFARNYKVVSSEAPSVYNKITSFMQALDQVLNDDITNDELKASEITKTQML